MSMRPMPPRAPRSLSKCAASGSTRGSCPCPSCNTATTAEEPPHMTRYFTEDHEWIEVEGDIGTVGITDYAQGQLGEITFVDLPEVGANVSKGHSVSLVDFVKDASDVYTPVYG